MSPEFDPSPFEAAMWTEVAALEQTRRDIDKLQAQLKTQRGTVTEAIGRFGAALQIAELAVPRATIRSLYWEHRDIYVESIAAGFSIEGGATQVHFHAGDSFFDSDCPGGCGRKVRLAARSSPLKPCAECAARRKEELDANHQLWRANHDARIADRDAWVRDQLAEGRTPEDLYVEVYGRFDGSGSLEHLHEMAADVDGQPLSEF